MVAGRGETMKPARNSQAYNIADRLADVVQSLDILAARQRAHEKEQRQRCPAPLLDEMESAADCLDRATAATRAAIEALHDAIRR